MAKLMGRYPEGGFWFNGLAYRKFGGLTGVVGMVAGVVTTAAGLPEIGLPVAGISALVAGAANTSVRGEQGVELDVGNPSSSTPPAPETKPKPPGLR